MRGLLIGDIRKPTDEDLRSYFDANRARFRLPPTLSLEQVSYRDPSQVPKDLLDELRAGHDPKTFGDLMPGYGRSLSRVSQRELAAILGAEAARPIIALDDDQWHGPLESIHGAHFVRIVGREPAREANYEDVKSYLEGDWMMAQSRKAIEQEIQRLRDSYDIVIEGVGEAAP